jgi:hypothetical protein
MKWMRPGLTQGINRVRTVHHISNVEQIIITPSNAYPIWSFAVKLLKKCDASVMVGRRFWECRSRKKLIRLPALGAVCLRRELLINRSSKLNACPILIWWLDATVHVIPERRKSSPRELWNSCAQKTAVLAFAFWTVSTLCPFYLQYTAATNLWRFPLDLYYFRKKGPRNTSLHLVRN